MSRGLLRRPLLWDICCRSPAKLLDLHAFLLLTIADVEAGQLRAAALAHVGVARSGRDGTGSSQLGPLVRRDDGHAQETAASYEVLWRTPRPPAAARAVWPHRSDGKAGTGQSHDAGRRSSRDSERRPSRPYRRGQSSSPHPAVAWNAGQFRRTTAADRRVFSPVSSRTTARGLT